jgi:hypothetical protein
MAALSQRTARARARVRSCPAAPLFSAAGLTSRTKRCCKARLPVRPVLLDDVPRFAAFPPVLLAFLAP